MLLQTDVHHSEAKLPLQTTLSVALVPIVLWLQAPDATSEDNVILQANALLPPELQIFRFLPLQRPCYPYSWKGVGGDVTTATVADNVCRLT